MSDSAGERELAFQLTHGSKPKLYFERQYQFHPGRAWRSDFAIWAKPFIEGTAETFREEGPALLVEVEGAVRGLPGHHQRVDGMTDDCEKYAEAMCLGYPVLRVMPSQVKSGMALVWIERLLKRLEG